MKGILALLVGAAAILGYAAFAPTANAQYGPIVGSLTCTVTSTTPTAGGSVVITVTVLDNNGVPQANVPVQFQISNQSGGASLSSPTTSNTNPTGQATDTLNVPTAGTVVVDVFAQGRPSALTCRLVINARAAAPVATSPTGAVGGTLQAPSTGDAGLSGSGTSNYLALAVVALFMTTISASAAFRALKR